MKSWTLEEGTAFIRDLENALLGRHHAAMAGSVLLAGEGKDLDVVVYPHHTADANVYAVRRALVDMGAVRLRTAEQMRDHWRTGDKKYVESWRTLDGRKVDIFYFGFEEL